MVFIGPKLRDLAMFQLYREGALTSLFKHRKQVKIRQFVAKTFTNDICQMTPVAGLNPLTAFIL